MATLTLQSTVPLNTNHKLPQLGFGVWDSPSHLTTQSCLTALKTGYRHLDTAQVYGNETEVGEAMKQSGLPREDIFVTTKVMSPEDDDAATYKKCLASVQKIAGDDGYVDLYLIHNVTCGAKGVKMLWQALEKLHKEGKAKSIGMSNTGIGIMEGMKTYAKVWPPAVDQLEVCVSFFTKMIVSANLLNSSTRGASNVRRLHTARKAESQLRLTVHLSGTKRQMTQT
jgi:diketogulonate reductase-like aldo/keto reductase